MKDTDRACGGQLHLARPYGVRDSRHLWGVSGETIEGGLDISGTS